MLQLDTTCTKGADAVGLDLNQLLRRPAREAGGRLPAEYSGLSAPEWDARITAAKAALGSDLVILGHHYQRDEIIRYADFRGDSFKLSQLAAARKDARFIVFCGVHFMAESADILSGPHQQVILPNLAAGCSMADMANIFDVEDCWDTLTAALGRSLVPVTYMNSAANLKAFCGRNNGIVCTSSNAEGVLEWAFRRGERILFFPDQHLGRNTAVKMGIDLDACVVWDPQRQSGGLSEAQLRRSKVILWKGHCSVHARFNTAQIAEARAKHPDINILVHPECRLDVVQAADYDGSTEYIIRKISEAPAGSKWAVGTEINLVNRLAKENPDKLVYCLDPVICPCSTMYRIHPAYVAWVLDRLVAGEAVNRITVEPDTKEWALVALNRMLAITA
jgi:quinolinate synthase